MQESQVCKNCVNTLIYKGMPEISEILRIQEVEMSVLYFDPSWKIFLTLQRFMV